jgi:hypothetical protein
VARALDEARLECSAHTRRQQQKSTVSDHHLKPQQLRQTSSTKVSQTTRLPQGASFMISLIASLRIYWVLCFTEHMQHMPLDDGAIKPNNHKP